MSQDRDTLRSQIFNQVNMKFKVEEITLFGAKIEVRQPTLEQIMTAQDSKDRARAAVGLMIRHCFVPGTTTPIFEDTDADMLLAMPMSQDLLRFNDAFEKLSGIDIGRAEKNLRTQEGETSSQ